MQGESSGKATAAACSIRNCGHLASPREGVLGRFRTAQSAAEVLHRLARMTDACHA